MALDPALVITWVVALGSLILMVFLLVGTRKGSVERRLGELSGPAGARPGQAGLLAGQAARGGLVVAAENPVDQWAARRMRQQERKKGLKERMTQAGLYGPGAAKVFFVLRLILAVGPVGLGFLAARMGHLPLSHGLLYGLMAGIAGTLAPGLWLDHLKHSRQTRIRRALPDALDVMVVCLEGGLSLTGALSRVARELAMAHPMLAVEFKILERQILMGRSTGEAVREMANRFDLEELRSMASVIIQAERIGSSVVGALDVCADTLRVKRHQRAEEMAHKASVKMLFPTLLFIFPAIFVVILGPAAIQIYQVLIQGVLRGVGH
jgi:tight adherence protein C